MNWERKAARLSTDSLDLINLEFPHSFQVQVLNEIPGGPAPLKYFPAARNHDNDGVALRITPDGASSWCGIFAPQSNGLYKTGVYSCPNPNQLCVASNGEAYMLDVRDADNYQQLSISPVREVVCATSSGVLVLADDTDIAAWDRSGRIWIERVSFDGIRGLHVDGDNLQGVAWSPESGEHPFTVNLMTGEKLT
jgi:hypothetical protein